MENWLGCILTLRKPKHMAAIKHIGIPKPCQQSWQGMTPDQNGRHCNACAKTVVDLTLMSTDDIIAYLFTNQHVCGRLESRQIEAINQQLAQPAQYTLGGWKRWSLAFGLLTSLGYFKANAQVKQAIVQTPGRSGKQNTSLEIVNAAITDSLVTIKGKVTDEQNRSVIGANVVTADGQHRIVTDLDGLFTLRVPKKTDFLRVNALGYLQKIALIDTKQITQEMVVMKEEKHMLGMVTINAPQLTLYQKFINWLSGNSF